MLCDAYLQLLNPLWVLGFMSASFSSCNLFFPGKWKCLARIMRLRSLKSLLCTRKNRSTSRRSILPTVFHILIQESVSNTCHSTLEFDFKNLNCNIVQEQFSLKLITKLMHRKFMSWAHSDESKIVKNLNFSELCLNYALWIWAKVKYCERKAAAFSYIKTNGFKLAVGKKLMNS